MKRRSLKGGFFARAAFLAGGSSQMTWPVSRGRDATSAISSSPGPFLRVKSGQAIRANRPRDPQRMVDNQRIPAFRKHLLDTPHPR
jgi:hypothetical protein